MADEESLQFKMCYMLGYEAKLRVHIEPEGCHPSWNTIKGAIRRSGKQIPYLKSFICMGCLHGPYGSGKNFQSFQDPRGDGMPESLREQGLLSLRFS